MAKPLYQLIKKGNKFLWTEEHERVFLQLKDAVVSSPILQTFDPRKECFLYTDASPVGLGAVLAQKAHGDPKESLKPVCFISRSLTGPERNYSQVEKEGLGVVWAMERLKQYL